jgi:hypothetical protein
MKFFLKELTFSWRWYNIGAVVEYLEAVPDRGMALITVTAEPSADCPT